MTNIAVLGGGALGMLLAGRLAAAGCAVTLWTRTDEQASQAAREGITLESRSGETARTVQVHAVPIRDVPPGFAGNVLVTVKQTALTASLAAFLGRTLARDAAVTMFQNGIGHVERMAAALPGRLLLAAVTTEGALRTGTVSVRHTGEGQTWIGLPLPLAHAHSSSEFAETLVRSMKQAGFTVFLSNDIQERMLRKLLINAVINPLTALWRVPNGELPATRERRIVMEALFRETADLLFAGSDSSELWQSVLDVCAATTGNRSSMLQDVLAGRETEIEALNGAICRQAASAGKEAPWNAAVTALVKAIQPPGERGR